MTSHHLPFLCTVPSHIECDVTGEDTLLTKGDTAAGTCDVQAAGESIN